MQTLIRASVAALIGLSATTLVAQDEGEKKGEDAAKAQAEVGKPAPNFTLKDLEGKEHKLGDYKGKLVVLEWISQDCPASRFIVPQTRDLAAKYAKADVVWLAIDTTHFQTVENNVKYKKEHKLPYPFLMDNDGKVGRKYGAKTTPHMFVIDKEGTLIYDGAFDDGGFTRAGERNYVAEVLDALLDGKSAPISTTKPYGCTVKYKK